MIIELMRSAPVVSIDPDGRTIEVIAVPWDEWTTVEHKGRGMVEESFAPGAFNRADERIRKDRPLVFLDHDRTNRDMWIGRVTNLYPDDPRGLRAEIRTRTTATARQAFDDAADGMLCASVGFKIEPAEQQWENRGTRCRVVKAFFDHLALVPQPAYVGAQVVSVRSATPPSATPNLDAMRAMVAERDARQYVIDV